MAAQFTEITIEEMDKYLKRAFRALRPKQNQKHSEYYYDLTLGPFVGVRVWTSVTRAGVGAGVGSDAIRIQLISLKDERPLEKGKAPIVKRTQGWKNSLQDRIEDCIEKYESNHEFWEGWAETRQVQRREEPKPLVLDWSQAEKEDDDGTALTKQDEEEREDWRRQQREREREREREQAQPTRPTPHADPDKATPKQVGYALVLLRGVNNNFWHEMIRPKFRGYEHVPNKNELENMSKRQISYLIDILKSSGQGGYRYAAELAEFEDYERSSV
jgi:hypothetical protein